MPDNLESVAPARTNEQLNESAEKFRNCLADMAVRTPKMLGPYATADQIRDTATMSYAICNETAYGESGLPLPRIAFDKK